MNWFFVLNVLVRAFEDGKITGKELKDVLNVFIDDNAEFSLEEVVGFLRSLLKEVRDEL
jgi:hypothetical protein